METPGLPPVSLLDRSATRGVWNAFSLEEVRDALRRTDTARPYRDFLCPLADIELSFSPKGEVMLRPGRAALRRRREHPASACAVEQLLGRVGLPSLGPNLGDLVAAGLSDLATAQANALIRARAGGRVVRLRARRRPGAGPRPVIEAVVGEGYATYDDASMVESLLHALPGSDAGPLVISASRTTEGFRLRLTRGGKPPKLCEPIPMLEARNSEVGRGATALTSGLFTLVCTNGMHRWEDGARRGRWVHLFGQPERIDVELAPALAARWDAAECLRASWQEARAVELPVQDAQQALGWIARLARRTGTTHRLRSATVLDVVGLLDDETTSRTKDGRWSLSTLADAITLRAQKARALEQFELERAAGRLLEGALLLARAGTLAQA